ncbi:MAG TPA: PAS domain S-box protein [Allocoleopsis sp.]
MAEHMQDVFWLTSADRQELLYVSPAFETVWGRPRESLYTHPEGHLNLIVDSIHPNDRDRVVAVLAEQLYDRYDQEYRIVRPDGSIRWVRSRTFAVQNSFGETWGFAGLSEDITKRKQDEELLHQREQEFKALVELSPDIISRFDRQLRHRYVNPAVELAAGIPAPEFLGKTNRELEMPPELLSLWEQSLQTVFQTGESDEHELRFLTPNGPKYYQSRLVPELATDGFVASVLGICRDVTQTKQTEELLRESEQRFRTVFEFAPIGIAITDSQGIWLETNQAVQEILGYTKEELQNRPLTEFTHPDDRAENLALLQELFSGKQTHISQEKRYVRKDGGIVWVNLSATAVCDDNGLPNYAIAMIQDISLPKQAQLQLQQAHDELEKRVAERTALLEQANTLLLQEAIERQKAQEALRLSEARFRLAVEHIPDVFVIYDAQRRFQFVNAQGLSLSGKTIEEHVGYRDEEIWPDEVTVHYLPILNRAVETRTLQTQECTIAVPHQSTLTFIVTYVPVLDERGEIDQILGITHDITQRKRSEERLWHSQAQLRHSEEQLRLALDAARMGFWDWNLQTEELAWSNHLEQLFGLAMSPFERTYDAFLAKIHLEDRDRVHSHTQHCLETGENYDMEFRVVLPNGTIRWLENKGQVIYDATSTPVRMVGVSLDISDRKLAEQRIKDSLQEKEVLLREIHHRVKNNLQVVSSLLDLQSQYIEDQAALEMFRESCTRVKSMALVHEKLYQSKDCAKIDFADYIENLISYLFQAYGVNLESVTLELKIDEITLNINTAIPCGLIISELVSNSLKHAFPSNRHGRIDVALYSGFKNYFTLIVRDDGVGFPKNSDIKNCKTLGLQLVQVLTSQLDGELELTSDRGSEIRIRIPKLNY